MTGEKVENQPIPAEAQPAQPVQVEDPPAQVASTKLVPVKDRKLNAAVVISILALAVSSLSFYFQNLRVDERAFLALSRPRFSNKGRVAFDTVFSNGGNKTIAISDVTVSVQRDQDPFRDVFSTNFPTLVLKPGEAISQSICIAVRDFEKMSKSAGPTIVAVNAEVTTSVGHGYRLTIDVIALGRHSFLHTDHLKDGKVVQSVPDYFVFVQQGPMNMLESEYSAKQELVFDATVGSGGLKEEFERRMALNLEQLRRDVGCEVTGATAT